MRRIVFFAVALVFFFAAALYVPQEASAAPTFARQTGMACNSCHFQHFPTLNAFGRAFKAGGYTQVGGQSLVEGDMLSLPTTLNASLVTKVRYQKTNGETAGGRNKGQVQFPDEGALLIGGRAGEHIGFLLEAQLIDNGAPVFASFKVPVTYNLLNTDVSVIPFTTDAAGPSYSYELLNTGALRMQRPIEHRAEMSAAQYLGTGDQPATGFAFVLHQPLWYANYAAYAPTHGTTEPGPYLTYGRIAVTPTIAGWDFGVGGQIWAGTSKESNNTRTRNDAWVIDAQAQGMIGSFPLGFYASYGVAGKSDANEEANTFNASTTDDKQAASVLAEFGVLPNRLTLFGGYLYGKGGTLNGNSAIGGQSATTVGANYQLAQNFNLQWNTSFYGGKSFDPNPAGRGDQLTTIMIFAAF